jgi:hypothetical protein
VADQVGVVGAKEMLADSSKWTAEVKDQIQEAAKKRISGVPSIWQVDGPGGALEELLGADSMTSSEQWKGILQAMIKRKG